MRLTGLAVLLALLGLAATGCASSYAVGNALLPEGIETAQIPDVEITGYLYVNAESPISLPVAGFEPGSNGSLDPALTQLDLNRAAIVIGPSIDSFGGAFDFESGRQANEALRVFQINQGDEESWGEVSSNRLLMVHGADSWAESVRNAFESNSLVALPDHQGLRWDILTNLPKNPPSRPIVAGIIRLDEGFPEALTGKVDFDLSGMDTAFGLVRVDTFGFGLYADSSIEVPDRFGLEFLEDTGYGVLLVSRSSYSGFLVAFMLGVVAGQTGMETIDIGNTNARYSTMGGIHLILKNKGNLVFAALAANRQSAEELILSAIAD